MSYARIALAAGAIALLVGCSSPEVRFDYDARNPFATYHSFAWQMAPSGRPGRAEGFDNPIEEGRVIRAVETELGAKGFTRAAAGNPDFLVTYYPIGEGARSSQVHLGLGIGLGPIGLGVGAPVGDRHREAVGGIVLEVTDFKSMAVVWKATAPGSLQESDSPEEAEADVKGAVHTMLKKFPPRP
jgi:hypothetical protein